MKKDNKIYGIDLGTTNSLIGCDNRLITRLMSSKVDFDTQTTVPEYEVGDSVVGSYKVDMGLGDEGKVAIHASSIVLKSLAEAVKRETGDTVEDVIISVPAYFSTNQRTAVRVAAEMSGMNLVNVINEPTAAALHICSKDGEDELRRGVYVVYDLGGGTFDVTIIDSRTSKYIVLATDGTILGGDDLDRAIADKVLEATKVPMYKRNRIDMAQLIEFAKEWKIEMQKKYKEYVRDNYSAYIKLPDNFIEDGIDRVPMNLGDYKKLVRETFGKTVSITSHLIEGNIPKGIDFKIIFVGGSTHDSYLCSYVLESANIGFDKAEFDTTPDFTVAHGVVKYATSIQNGGADVEFRDVTKQLSIESSDGKSIPIIPANTNIPCKRMSIAVNSEDTNKLQVKLYQGNSVIASNNEYLGYLEYDYGVTVPEGRGDVEITVSVDKGGFITLEVEDIVNFGEKVSVKLKGI